MIRFISINLSAGVVFSFCQLDTNKTQLGRGNFIEELPPSEPLDKSVGRFNHLWSMWEGPIHCEMCHTVEGGPWLYQKTSWANPGEQNSNWHSSRVRTSRLFLLELLTDFPQWGTLIRIYKPNNPFPTWASQCFRLCFTATWRNKIHTLFRETQQLSVRQKIINSFASVELTAHVPAELELPGFQIKILTQSKKKNDWVNK